MTRRHVAAALAATATVVVTACANAGDSPKPAATTPPPGRSSEAADRTAPGQQAAAPATDFCALLPAAEITEVTGLAIERAQRTSDGCEWFAAAAAQRQRGEQNVRDTFNALTKQEPATAAEGVRSMENLLGGLRGAAGANQPVFAVTVHHGDADQAEMLLRGTVSMNGGHVEPIEGLGDRAFEGPMGAFFYVRKGTAAIMFNGVGRRDQTIALARRIVPRIQ